MKAKDKAELRRREVLRLEIIAEARERAEALRKFAAIGSRMNVSAEVAAHYAEAGATFAIMGLEARGLLAS